MFLDRDGTINADCPDYVKNWEEFRFLPRVLEAMCRLASLEVDIFVVTNQSAIGRHVVNAEVVAKINRRMLEQIERYNGGVTGVYVCPQAPWEGCWCRKPKPGLLQQAAKDHGIVLARSFMV